MQTVLLSVMIFGSLSLHLYAEHYRKQRYIYFFKPMTTLLVIALALLSSPVPSPFYQKAILVGLVFSLLGDVFLMVPGDRFIPGLLSFLVAHVCYILAFTHDIGFQGSPLPALPFLLGGILLFWVLWRHLGNLRVPVLLYAILIMVMGWQALARWVEVGSVPALLAAIGATLFVLSDAALAIDRFINPYPAAPYLIMGTYIPAQWLIALSI